jgi:hypothetical protein
VRRFSVPLFTVLLVVGVVPAGAKTITEHCTESHRATEDPIMFPGQPGASHLHVFFGNRTTNAFSTSATLMSQESTCTDEPLDASGYWVPAVYVDGAEAELRVAPYWKDDNQTVATIPTGFTYVASGWGTNVGFACTSGGGISDQPLTCKGGQKLKFRANFPSCLAGTVALYPTGKLCPPGTVKIPRLLLQVGLPVSSGLDHVITLSSGDYTTMHADFFMAFDPVAFQSNIVDALNGSR